jgi:putative tryptophan/tyrosine transport system substrate-binding protein
MPMRRREFISLFGGAAVTWPVVARAQQSGQPRRIGLLLSFRDDRQTQDLVRAFRVGLEENGWHEGRAVSLVFRYADENLERLSAMAVELVQTNVDVIVTAGTPAIKAALSATRTTPIIMATVGDPVGANLVESLSHPGGNVTGLSLVATDLSTKRLELIKEALPGLVRVAMLWNSTNASLALQFKETQTAARLLGIELLSLEATNIAEILSQVEAAAVAHTDALITVGDPIQTGRDAEIITLATRLRIATIGEFKEFAVAGAIMSYGPSRTDMWRRAAGYADKILKGAKPADLPVQQPTRFELVINLKAAKALGLTVPASLLARADEVIE